LKKYVEEQDRTRNGEQQDRKKTGMIRK